jgi:hypothetical protein
MGDKFQTVQAGERIGISASTWNAMLEAAKAHEQRKFNVTSESDPLLRQADICKVLSEAATDLPRFAVVGIEGPLISPADNLVEFQSRAAFRVGVPTESSRGKFAILTEPIPAGRIGQAWVSGVCPAQVFVTDGAHQYCEAAAGATTALKSDCFGSARILWREAGTGLRWALIRLGNRDDNGRHFRFELLGSLAGGSALAEIYGMTGEPITQDLVLDPENIFQRLDEGDRGIAVKDCGQFWAIQAKCPQGLGDL